MNTLQRAQWRQKKNLKKRARLTLNKKINHIYKDMLKVATAAAKKEIRMAAREFIAAQQSVPVPETIPASETTPVQDVPETKTEESV